VGITSKTNPLRVFGLFAFQSSLKLGAWLGLVGWEDVDWLRRSFGVGVTSKANPLRVSWAFCILIPRSSLGLGSVL